MVPYYLLDPVTPFPFAFKSVNLKWASNLVSIGAILSLITVYEKSYNNFHVNLSNYLSLSRLYGTMFPLPRILYAMSSDGLLFSFISKILPKTKTPFIACIISGLIAGKFCLNFIFNFDQVKNFFYLSSNSRMFA